MTAPAAAVRTELSPTVLRAIITVTIMAATLMHAIDMTIATVALPHMQGNLSTTQDQISWVITSYIVASAIMTPPTGWLAGRLGRRRLFLIAVGGFTVASFLCGTATSLAEIVTYRFLQGAFGAALVPLSQATLLDTYPREKHGSAMAIWGIGIMVGPIVGPTLGGYLTELYDWRWVFYINIPVGILAFLGIMTFMPETERDYKRRFDYFGFAVLTLAVGAFQLMLDRGERLDWFDSPEIIIEAMLALAALYMFATHTITSENPFFHLRIFKDRNFVVGTFLIFMLSLLSISAMTILPAFMQNLMGYPVLTTGLIMAPRGVGTMAAMIIVGPLVNRVGGRNFILAGAVLAAIALWEMSTFTLEVSSWDLIWTGILHGMGLGFLFVPLSTLTYATLPSQDRTEAAGLFSLMRNLGGSIGVAVLVGTIVRLTQINHAAIAEHISPYREVLGGMSLPEIWDMTLPAGRVALDITVNLQAGAIAHLNAFKIMMGMTLISAPLVFLLRDPEHRRES